MPKQRQEGNLGQPLGHSVAERSKGLDSQVHPEPRKPLLAHVEDRGVRPFSSDAASTKAAKLDSRVHPHGIDAGTILGQHEHAQPFATGDFNSRKSGEIDRRALPGR